MELKVGQKVFVQPLQSYIGKTIVEAEVISIGRKYFQVKSLPKDITGYNKFSKHKFKIEGGCNLSEYSSSWQVRLSLQEIEDEKELQTIKEKVYSVFKNYGCKLSLDKLKRIDAIIEEK